MTTSQELHDRIAGQNVPKRFLRSVSELPEQVVIRHKDATGEWADTTFSELAHQVAAVAGGLQAAGIERGDRVAIMATNRPEFHVIDLATLFLGATPVSIYNSSAPEQIRYMLSDCEAKAAIIEDAYQPRFAAITDQLPSLSYLAVLDGDVGDGAGAATVVAYSELASAKPIGLEAAAATAQLDDLATIIYTSGTTGNPKGVMLTHSNVCWTLESIAEDMLNELDFDSLVGFRHLSYLPMAHIFERLIGHYYMMFLGVQTTCLTDTSQLGSYIAEIKPHLLIGVPRVWEKIHAGVTNAIAADPDKATKFQEGFEAARPIRQKIKAGTATDDEIATYEFLDEVAFTPVKQLIGLDQARICVSGAAPLRSDVQEWFDTVGVPLTEGYGLSETTAITTWAFNARAGYVGTAAPGVEVKLDQDGEVLTRGGNIFAGYLNNQEKTDEVITDGWFHTGDIGEITDDGYLKIVDRKKELIITAGGKNLSPANLESALKSIPLVGQACAIGDQRPYVAALVVLDVDAAAAWATRHDLTGDDATLAALANNPAVIDEINTALPEAMQDFNSAESVKKIKVLGEEWLPDSDVLTPTSKLKRRGILQRFAAEIEQLYNDSSR